MVIGKAGLVLEGLHLLAGDDHVDSAPTDNGSDNDALAAGYDSCPAVAGWFHLPEQTGHSMTVVSSSLVCNAGHRHGMAILLAS